MICEFKIPTIMWTSILINDCLKIGHFFHQINLSYDLTRIIDGKDFPIEIVSVPFSPCSILNNTGVLVKVLSFKRRFLNIFL